MTLEILREKIKQKSSNITYLDYDVNTLPETFSWTDIDGVNFVTPPRGQSPFHSCETFAFTAAVEVMVHKEVGYPFGCDLSEAHLYSKFECSVQQECLDMLSSKHSAFAKKTSLNLFMAFALWLKDEEKRIRNQSF